MGFLTSYIFKEKLNGDTRSPIASFPIDFPLFSNLNVDVYAPSFEFWLQVVGLLAIEIPIIAIISYVVFYRVLPDRNSFTSLMLVVGVLVPTLFALPYAIIDLLGMENLLLKFLSALLPFMVILKLVETLHFYSPIGIESSCTKFMIYYATPVQPKIADGSFETATKADSIESLRATLVYYLFVSCALSILIGFHYHPFSSHLLLTTEPTTLHHVDIRKILDNFFLACLFQLALTFFIYGLGLFGQAFTGFRSITGMENPLLKSTSPTEFWGKRWNLIIHGLLKRGIFKPTLSHTSSKLVAVVVTFFVSGALHEWLLHVMSYGTSITPMYGNNTLFFLWNAAFVLIENAVYDWRIIYALKKNLPSSMITIALVSCVLPVAHWFCDDYVQAGYFDHMKVGFPIITLSWSYSKVA